MSEAGKGSKAGSAREIVDRIGGAYRHLCCVAAGVLGVAEGTEDIVQQALMIAVEKNQDFESEGQFVGWLVGVVKHCALNDRRKKIRRKTNPTDPTLLTEVTEAKAIEVRMGVDAAGVELSPMQTSFDDKVVAALNQLQPEARSALLLRTVEDLSYKEISELMGIKEGTAMSLVHRSRMKLRKILTRGSADSGDAYAGGRHE